MSNNHKPNKRLSPYFLIVFSFLALILLGGFLLSLPISSNPNANFSIIDAFFVATSAVTITGLVPVVDISITLTLFGKIVLALLIQLGGLGIITLTIFIMILIGAKIGITNRVLIRENLNMKSVSGVVSLIKKIILITFIIELLGFIINLIVFVPIYPLGKAIGISAFHAISSFNNAGFDLLPGAGLVALNGNVLLMINTGLLIILGGLGFIVILDLLKKKSFRGLTIHTRIVLMMNLILWVGGGLLLKLGQFGYQSISWLDAFVLAISARTAGIPIVDMGILTSFNGLVLIILMFIGGSPSSTAGGVKTTTIFTIFKTVYSFATGREAKTQNRRISDASKRKAFVLLSIAVTIVMAGTLLILLFEEISIGQAIFEIVSAGSNTGYSLGLTPTLKTPSKFVIMAVMFIGRVGPVTIITLFNRNWYKISTQNITYLEERIIIG